MNTEFLTVLSLKKVLETAGEGMGMAQAVIRGLRDVTPLGGEPARLVLLGFPLSVALRPLVESGTEEVSMLASLIVSAPRSSSSIVGRSGGILAGTLEKWVKAKDSKKLEQKALRFRSLVTCGVLGAVTAMLAALAPLVGSLDFTGASQSAGASDLVYAAAGYAAISSSMLGLFMSGRGFYLNVLVAMGVFVLVSVLASPLADVPSVSLWGIK